MTREGVLLMDRWVSLQAHQHDCSCEERDTAIGLRLLGVYFTPINEGRQGLLLKILPTNGRLHSGIVRHMHVLG